MEHVHGALAQNLLSLVTAYLLHERVPKHAASIVVINLDAFLGANDDLAVEPVGFTQLGGTFGNALFERFVEPFQLQLGVLLRGDVDHEHGMLVYVRIRSRAIDHHGDAAAVLSHVLLFVRVDDAGASECRV